MAPILDKDRGLDCFSSLCNDLTKLLTTVFECEKGKMHDLKNIKKAEKCVNRVFQQAKAVLIVFVHLMDQMTPETATAVPERAPRQMMKLPWWGIESPDTHVLEVRSSAKILFTSVKKKR
jgi:hypothetical protein